MPRFDEEIIKTLDYDEAMVASAAESAKEFSVAHNIDVKIYTFDEEIGQYYDSEGQEPVVNALLASGVESSGGRFIIPVAVPEEVSSGDERSFEKDSITTRDLPLPLMWQIATADGHKGAVVVGRIDSIERLTTGGLGNARGVFDVGPYGREAERMVRGGFLRGVSVDLDKFEAQVEPEDFELESFDTKEEAEDAAKKAKKSIKNEKILVQSARLMGITIVPKPAFQECFIMIEEEPTLDLVDEPLPEGIYEETPDDYEYQLAALAASAAPMVPPRAWFTNPGLTRPTPLKVTDDGKVFGHIASWTTSHIGRASVKPPRSASKYAYFRTGELRTDDGDIQVGQLTLAGGHASLQASAEEAIKHYDDTQSAVADVVAGEDEFGIWVSGALRPDVTPSQLRAFRASAPSGDWRPINGRLELVAVCAVNVPGFPIARAITASGGVPGALVAAGAAYLAELREADQMAELDRRISLMEKSSLSVSVEAARSRMTNVMAQRNSELSSRVQAARERMASVREARDAELNSKLAQLRERFNNH